jgi:uncharacterized protein (DUF2235 family)
MRKRVVAVDAALAWRGVAAQTATGVAEIDMAKRIVVCLDGTNNRFGDSETNVLRIFRMSTRDPAHQIAYYQPGVGTIAPEQVLGHVRQLFLRALDSATAWMLQRHVSSAYRFLMRHWEPGDEIFVFGFSRGAFAARVLCGMLFKVGLLHAGMEEMLPFAWREYRRERDFKRAATFRRIFSRRVRVKFLGVWDTVSAVGTPWRPRRFDYTARNRDIDVVRHAIALDERRVMFAQNQWTAKPTPGQDVRELWFPGVHSDVGGGYAPGDDALSLISLAWMLGEAQAAGLHVDPAIATGIFLPRGDAAQPFSASDALARMTATHHGAARHESLRGAWSALEWLPVPRWVVGDDGAYTHRLWRWHRGNARALRAGALIHESVDLRRRHVSSDYAASNLRDDSVIVPR